MTHLTAFFQSKADAFSRGDFFETSKAREFPSMIYLQEGLLPIPTRDAYRSLLARMRLNLANLDYTRTDMSIEDAREVYPNNHRIVVRWTHRTSKDETIESTDVVYYCKTAPEGWKISLSDVRTPIDPRLTAGLPILSEPVECAEHVDV